LLSVVLNQLDLRKGYKLFSKLERTVNSSPKKRRNLKTLLQIREVLLSSNCLSATLRTMEEPQDNMSSRGDSIPKVANKLV